MPTEPLPVDPLLSYAQRDGDEIRVVLALRGAPFDRRRAGLRFEGEDGAVRTTASVTPRADGGLTVDGRIAADQLPDGVWRLKLRPGPDAPLHGLRTRLVMAADRPIALLPHFAADVVGT